MTATWNHRAYKCTKLEVKFPFELTYVISYVVSYGFTVFYVSQIKAFSEQGGLPPKEAKQRLDLLGTGIIFSGEKSCKIYPIMPYGDFPPEIALLINQLHFSDFFHH